MGIFGGIDEDARCIEQFIKRYLTAFDRWNSPKFLFGESYGTPRTCVLSLGCCSEDGVDLNGVVLQSGDPRLFPGGQPGRGLLPTLAADAWFHNKVTLSPPPTDLPTFMKDTQEFDRQKYAAALAAYALTETVEPNVLGHFRDDIIRDTTHHIAAMETRCVGGQR